MRVARFGLTPVNEVRADKENEKNKEKKKSGRFRYPGTFEKRRKKKGGKKLSITNQGWSELN